MFLLCASRVLNDQRTYLVTDSTFYNYDIKSFATFDIARNVFDLKGNFLGNPLSE
jgi:hypothetical protein